MSGENRSKPCGISSSVLPESPRWLISKGRFDDAEKILRRIAVDNKRNFDRDAYEQVKEEQQKVNRKFHRIISKKFFSFIQSLLNKHTQEGILGLFKSRIMLIISLNLFFQWYGNFQAIFSIISFFSFVRLVQNLVFYGVSQNTGTWKFNPYLSFTVSALVELAAYILVHLILDRVGRKLPYCLFATLFGLVALLVLPVQKFMAKDSSSKCIRRIDEREFIVLVQIKYS